jgi:hypothetical protein
LVLDSGDILKTIESSSLFGGLPRETTRFLMTGAKKI